MVLEREVETYLRNRVKALGGKCIKLIPDYARGYPDRLVILPGGVLIWVETKKPRGGRLSLMQRVCHGELRKLGQVVEVVWSKEDADRLLARLV
jgi:hypothetical protein